MTKEKFGEIIEKYNLYSFDSLIKVVLKDGLAMKLFGS
jgi:hypothetical protein